MEFDVGKRITFFRELKGLTTNKLAYNSGVAQSFVRDIELGSKNPTIITLSSLCDALGITLKDFFDDGSLESFLDNPLMREAYKLSPEQRTKLTEFLKLI